jgi:hypothetical protein
MIAIFTPLCPRTLELMLLKHWAHHVAFPHSSFPICLLLSVQFPLALRASPSLKVLCNLMFPVTESCAALLLDVAMATTVLLWVDLWGPGSLPDSGIPLSQDWVAHASVLSETRGLFSSQDTRDTIEHLNSFEEILYRKYFWGVSLKTKANLFMLLGREMFLKESLCDSANPWPSKQHTKNTIGTSLLPNPACQADIPLFPLLFLLPTLFCFAK